MGVFLLLGVIHEGKHDEWTRRQAAWGLNWVKYKSGGDVFHGRIGTAWHKKSHRQFPVSHRQQWIRGEPRYRPHTHTLWSPIVGYHFVCVSVLHMSFIVSCVKSKIFSLCRVLKYVCILQQRPHCGRALLINACAHYGKFEKVSLLLSSVKNSKHTRLQTNCSVVLCLCAVFSGLNPGIPRAAIIWVSLINFAICCISSEHESPMRTRPF